MGDAVTVQLLGPVLVRRDGAEVDLGGPKQLAVLAALALAGGRACSPAELATELWGHDVPPSAPGTLRAYVSRLRSRMPPGAVDRSAAGWRLAVQRDDVDALRFQDLVTEADEAEPARRRELLEEALTLWSGPPLGGLDGLPGAAAHRERLVDLHASAAERLLALRLAAGERREVAREAAALAAELPYREGPVTLLATALARSGRHADALAAVTHLRDRLAEDLGLDPSPALEDLRRRLLLHDPTLLGEAPADRDDTSRRPLPLPLTSFVGRETDLRAVSDALTLSRLVTLVGPGGAGKTRLAVEALRRHDRPGTDGPWVVELGYVTEPGQVVDAVAQALGVTSTGPVDATAVADAVSGRSLLLLLDTCEHLVDEVASLVTHLLGACGGMQVLATSREVLGVPGEQVLAVAPLPTGRPGAPGDAELLFAERAASVVPGFTLDPATAPAVHRLVRALDGIPLAVELAAARLAVMGLDDLVAMLDDRFALLEGGLRTAPPHQRTLEATVAWSHDLLDDDERALFRTASAFAGPFTLAALRALADPDHGRSVVGLLASLTAKSMVQVDRAADARESRTYRLLETMRAFGRGRTDPVAAAELADRHLRWFASDADAAFVALRGPDARRCLTHLDLTRPDMRAALRHAVDQGDRAAALRLVGGLATWWFHRGHLREGLHWVAAAAGLPGTADPAVEARAALGAAQLSYGTGDATSLDPAFLAGLDRAAAQDEDPSVAAVAACYAGYFQAMFGRLDAAQGLFGRAGALVAGDAVEPWAVAEVLFSQGQLLRAQDLRGEALAVLQRAGQVGDACGHVWAAGSARYIAAKIHLDRRQGGPALAAVAQTLPATLDLGIHTSTLALLHVAAGAVAALDRHAEAATLLGAVDGWGDRLGYHPARMDPLDGERHRALVREGLTADELAEATAHGRALPLAEAVARVVSLAASLPAAAAPAARATPAAPSAQA